MRGLHAPYGGEGLHAPYGGEGLHAPYGGEGRVIYLVGAALGACLGRLGGVGS